MNGPGSWWTEERDQTLRRLAAEGKRASLIASELGDGCSKNMVIGKCYREDIALIWKKGLTAAQVREIYASAESGDELAKRLGCSASWIRKIRRNRAYKGRWAPAHPTPDPFPERGHCLWGIGHPGSPGFHFCGQPNVAGKPYCPSHAAIAYVRVTPAVAREMAAAELLLTRAAPRVPLPA